MVYDTSVISAPLLGVAVYSTSIRLSSNVPVGNFVVTVILGLSPNVPVFPPPVVPPPPAPPPPDVFVIGFVLLLLHFQVRLPFLPFLLYALLFCHVLLLYRIFLLELRFYMVCL